MKNIFLNKLRPAPVICLLFALLCCGSASGQTYRIMLDSSDYVPKKKRWGRNMDNMVIPYFQLNWAIAPDQPGAATLWAQSFNFRLGVDYKRKITSWFSAGIKLQYALEDFYLRQDSNKVLPDTVLHDAEWFNLQNFVAGAFVRFNFDPRRGNHYGTYLELGVNHVLAGGFFHSSKNKLPGGETEHVKISGLTYTNMNYGEVYGKLGWKHVAVVAYWRFTPLFKTGSGYPNLPTVKVGLELAY